MRQKWLNETVLQRWVKFDKLKYEELSESADLRGGLLDCRCLRNRVFVDIEKLLDLGFEFGVGSSDVLLARRAKRLRIMHAF